MKITKIIEQLGLKKTPHSDRDGLITISEAHTLWETLAAKYDAVYLTGILLNFVKDDDLKIILEEGMEALKKQISIMENLMTTYNIPLTNRPPESINLNEANINIIMDDIIFRTIHSGIQGHLYLLSDNFKHAMSSIIREAFREAINIEMDLYDAFTEYGKLKGYLHREPCYKA